MRLIILEDDAQCANFLRDIGRRHFAGGCLVFSNVAECDRFIRGRPWNESALVTISIRGRMGRELIKARIRFGKSILTNPSTQFYRVIFFYDMDIGEEGFEELNEARPYQIEELPRTGIDLEDEGIEAQAEHMKFDFLFTSAAENLSNLYQKSIDALTGVLTKREIIDRIEAQFSICRQKISALFIDVDNLKQINDRYGHDVGSEVLKKVAFAIWSTLRPLDEVGRYGGDEFLVLIKNIGARDIKKICERILEKVKSVKVLSHNNIITPSVTIGAAVGTEFKEGAKVEVLIEKADMALLEGKKLGKGRYQITPQQKS